MVLRRFRIVGFAGNPCNVTGDAVILSDILIRMTSADAKTRTFRAEESLLQRVR